MKKDCLSSGIIHVNDLNLWAHVGVLDSERETGQCFTLDFSLWLDLEMSAKNDDLLYTADYSLAIERAQQLAFEIRCKTIEHFSERVMDLLEELYGPVKMRVLLKKVNAPVNGFTGTVAIERHRYW